MLVMMMVMVMVVVVVPMGRRLRKRSIGREHHQHRGDRQINHKIVLFPVIQLVPRAETFGTLEAKSRSV